MGCKDNDNTAYESCIGKCCFDCKSKDKCVEVRCACGNVSVIRDKHKCEYYELDVETFPIKNNILTTYNRTKRYTLDINKIKDIEDVKKVLASLCISIDVVEGHTSEMYELLKDYLK